MPTTQTPQPAGTTTVDARSATEPPVFVLTTSRSGSTLLRFILDSHPDLVCPPETGVSSASVQLARTWHILEHAGSTERLDVHARLELSPRARAAVRDAIDQVFGGYLRARGKKRWCDKSLDTYMFADVLAQVYPEAKFICLVRHCMDVIASGVETCPWGLSRFGFDPYVAQYPGNSVAAIGGYWLACTNAILSFHENHPDACHRIRYEDLVTAPEETAADIFAFIGAAQAPGIAEACFRTPHEGDGPGDEKIWFTDGVKSDSMGRGVVVPAAALPAQLRESINETLAKLDYRTVEEDWNAAVGRVDPRANADEPAGSGAPGSVADEVAATIRALESRIGSASAEELAEITRRWPAVVGTTVGLVVQAPSGEHQELEWCFAPPAGQDGSPARDNGDGQGGDGAQKAMVIAGPASWRSLLDRATNLVSEITSGRLRFINPHDSHRLRSEEMHAVAALLGLAQIPVARRLNGADALPEAGELQADPA